MPHALPSETREEETLVSARAKPGNPWLAEIAVIVLMPVISLAVAQLIVTPRFKNAFGALPPVPSR